MRKEISIEWDKPASDEYDESKSKGAVYDRILNSHFGEPVYRHFGNRNEPKIEVYRKGSVCLVLEEKSEIGCVGIEDLEEIYSTRYENSHVIATVVLDFDSKNDLVTKVIKELRKIK